VAEYLGGKKRDLFRGTKRNEWQGRREKNKGQGRGERGQRDKGLLIED